MKRLLTLLVGLFTICQISAKTETQIVTIGTESVTHHLPYATYWRNSTSQFLYTADELDGSGRITDIAFDVAVPKAQTPSSLKIYMCHKDGLITGESDYATRGTLVFEGSPTIASYQGWETILLDTPFDYNGMDNLLIIVCRQNTSWVYSEYNCSYQDCGYSLMRKSDSDSEYGLISATSGYEANVLRPNIRLTKLENCVTLSSVSIGENTSQHSAPFLCESNYSTAQFCYTPAEVGAEKALITDVAFINVDTEKMITTEYQIYMGHRSTAISSRSDYTKIKDLTLVSSGNTELGGGIDGIILDQEFEYNGRDNLVIVICHKSSTTSTIKYCSTPMTTGYSLIRKSSSNADYGKVDFTSGYTVTKERPDIWIGKKDVFPISINFDQERCDLLTGQTTTLKANIYPKEALNQKLTWDSNDYTVATVSSTGKVTAKGKGTTLITATTCSGKIASCYVNVVQPLKSITLSDTLVTTCIGREKALKSYIYPKYANNTAIVWSTSDPTVATVSSTGVITGVAVGTCDIRCDAADGYGAHRVCRVTVTQQVTDIALSATEVTLWNGVKKYITATKAPENATNKKVVWSSSNTAVATVASNGIVTAVGKGKCTIKCSAADGFGAVATCAVTVKQQVTSISLSSTRSITAGATDTLAVKVLPSNATDKSLVWKSTNTSVATISSTGVLTALKPGTTQIICVASDRKTVRDTCLVEVKPLKITDSNPQIPAGTYAAEAIWYTRKVKADKYYPVCLPYDINLKGYKGSFTNVFKPTNMALLKSNGTLMVLFKEVSFTETIPAGEPFVVRAAADASVVFKNAVNTQITTLSDPIGMTLKAYDFDGTTGFLKFDNNIYISLTGTYSKLTEIDKIFNLLGSSGSLYASDTVLPYRFYVFAFEFADAYVRDVVFSFDESEATAIEQIITDAESHDGDLIFNVNGQRVSRENAKKGIFIENGKKILIK